MSTRRGPRKPAAPKPEETSVETVDDVAVEETVVEEAPLEEAETTETVTEPEPAEEPLPEPEAAPEPEPEPEAPVEAQSLDGLTKVYVARKRMRLGPKVILPGQEVPEAAEWPRLDSWIRTGHIVETYVQR